MEKIKILIIDDCEVSRKGISKLLSDVPQFFIIGDCQYADEAIKIIEERNVDVVIMDVNLSDMDEREVVRKIKSTNPELGVLIFSSKTDVEYLVSLAKAGVSSYLKKTIPLQELIRTIKIIHHGESYFSQKIASILSQHLVHNTSDSIPQHYSNNLITPRELEVLKLISEEYTNKEIAQKLFISPRTVDTHRRNLLIKLDVKKTAGLVKYYYMINGQDSPIISK